MKLFTSALFLFMATANTATAAPISRQECIDQGGEVVGDIGDGAIFRPDYVCASTGAPPTDSVVADVVEATARQGIATEGEVCCGGTGEGVEGPGEVGLPTGGGEFPCTMDADCPPINCFVAPCDVNVCVDGFCELQPPTMTRRECWEEYNGILVGDIGDGAIHRPGYLCDSNGQRPIGTVVTEDGEPIPKEGEVCCGPGEEMPNSDTKCTSDADCPVIMCLVAPCDVNVCVDGFCELQAPEDKDRPLMTRKECIEEYNGVIVGDIGDGAIHRPDYICESNGQPPIGTVVPSEGEPIPIEGEVCCGPAKPDFPYSETKCTSDADCPVIMCFVAPCDVNVCVDGFCELQAPEGDDLNNLPVEGLMPSDNTANRTQMTRQECTDKNDGVIVGDIGDGAIHRPNYICESNGEAPIATVVPSEGEPIASEGEVCCGPAGTAENLSTNDGSNTDTETSAVADLNSGAISDSRALFAVIVTVLAVVI